MIDWRRNQIAIPIILMVINVLLYEVGWKAIMYYGHSYPGADVSSFIYMFWNGILFLFIPAVDFFYIVFHFHFYKGPVFKRIMMGLLPFTFYVVYFLGYILNNGTEYLDTVRLNKFNQNYTEYQKIVNYAYDTVNQKTYVGFAKDDSYDYQGKINPKIASQIQFWKVVYKDKEITYIYFWGWSRTPGLYGGVCYVPEEELFNAYITEKEESNGRSIILDKIKPHWYFFTFTYS